MEINNEKNLKNKHNQNFILKLIHLTKYTDIYSENVMLTKVNLHKKNLALRKNYNSNEKNISKNIFIVQFPRIQRFWG